MRPLSRDLLSRTLRAPDSVTRFSTIEWDMLVRQARAANLLARLLHVFRQHDLIAALPTYVRWHFDAAEMLANRQRGAMLWELKQLPDTLAELDGPLIVLQGAACVAAGLPAAAGRLFNELDILVPHRSLTLAESALIQAGWHASGLSEYDKRYYRRWMHELPPMHHPRREFAIRVHFAALPAPAHNHPATAMLLRRSVAVDALPGIHVLAVEDRILHTASRLFNGNVPPHGLRDLSDLDLLLRDALADRAFWQQLTARADELKLNRSLFYALRYLCHFLATPVPDRAMRSLDAAAPSRATLALMDRIFTRVLAPVHASCADAFSPAARQAAFMHAHWQRMPAHRVISHLLRKPFIAPVNAQQKRLDADHGARIIPDYSSQVLSRSPR